MTVSTVGQVEFAGFDLTGEGYELGGIEGLADIPDVRSADLSLVARDGVLPGYDRMGGRTVTLTVAIYGWSQTELADRLAAFKRAFRPGGATEVPLSFWLPGVADTEICRMTCRPRRLAVPLPRAYLDGWAVIATVELFASDPRITSELEYTGSTLLPTFGPGLIPPVVFPMVFGTLGPTGSVLATNEGDWPADVIIRIDGPVVNPRVENRTAGLTISLAYDLPAGQWLTIDTKNRTVLLNGTASRYDALMSASRWWTLLPGSNEILFRAGASAATATMSIVWHSAWL